MAEPVLSSLRIEPLNLAHLARCRVIADSGSLPRFQTFLISDWLARFEQRFPDILPSRSPRCLVALEADQLLAMIVIYPYNRRGTCWTLHLPELIGKVRNHSLREVRHDLLQNALHLGTPQSYSWVIRCPASDVDAIALLRELGFQPLRPYQSWLPPRLSINAQQTVLADSVTWCPINRHTAQLLWSVEQIGNFSHLRQIKDRHWLDILDRSGPGCGILMDGETVLAGCIRLTESSEQRNFELLRGMAWDTRLDRALPVMLARILQQGAPHTLVTDFDDVLLGQILEAQGWQRGAEQLLLGRSMWRRHIAHRNLHISRSLDEVFSRLRPQGTPLPNPTLGPR
ncbi:hypothetical protein [Synechococcus sp. M16CYN]|uniref:hypothetical protein n=1 Tax=Synechococcus sp. M16CYN TaxID=3103139 RepID=UPI0033423EEC